MIIRKAKKSDLKEVVKLFIEGYKDEPYNERWTEKNASDKINEYFQGGEIKIVLDDEKIVAFMIYHEMIWDNHTKLYGDEIVVDKNYRGKGIGTLLIKDLEKMAKEKGNSSIEFVSHIDSRAFQLYTRLGYKENGLVVMEKKI